MEGTLRLVSAPREGSLSEQVERLRRALDEADAVVIGAGAGLSTAAGFTYGGDRFTKWFGDFADRYGFTDMYSGGFYPFDTFEEYWAFWSRNIYCNRYLPAPGSVYADLFGVVRNRDYFVLTTNVDHQFQIAGFDKHRLFYTQGDYGLFQCSEPCHAKTYDNEAAVCAMLKAQGYVKGADGAYELPEGVRPLMEVPSDLVPHCPVCGKPMSTNLRIDNTFVEDEGWHRAAERWADFQRRHERTRTLYLELGVGYNTPAIIKFPFWRATANNPLATYVCVNRGEAAAPVDIERQSILIAADIVSVISECVLTMGSHLT